MSYSQDATILGDSATKFATVATSKKDLEAARKNADAMNNLAAGLPWEPIYASQNDPGYQTPQSPVARQYLESMLLGYNPDLTSSVSPNAAAMKAYQQSQSNRIYGTPEQNADQGAIARNRPFQMPKPITGPITGSGRDAFAGPAPAGDPAGGYNPLHVGEHGQFGLRGHQRPDDIGQPGGHPNALPPGVDPNTIPDPNAIPAPSAPSSPTTLAPDVPAPATGGGGDDGRVPWKPGARIRKWF
jgi:hypothetical protein